jgi:hypothetical protein
VTVVKHYYLSIPMHRLSTFSEPKNQINQPSEKRNHGNDPPERLLPNGSEVFANDVDNCQHRQQVKKNADFYPYNCRCYIQCYPFPKVSISNFKRG